MVTNGPRDLGYISGRVIPKTQKMGKKYRPPLHLGVVAIEKGAFGSPSTMFANFTYIYIYSPKLYIYIYIYIYMYILYQSYFIHTYIYMYILSSTDRLFRSLRNLQCG